MMSEPLQRSLFEESDESTSSPEASHVSPSASQGSKKGRKTTDTSGLISHDSSAKSDPSGYSLRTYLASELSRLTSYSKTWKNQGTPLGRSWWALMTLAPRTVAKGCGLSEGSDWPTPTGQEYGSNGDSPGETGPRRPSLSGAAKLWPTARAEDSEQTGGHRGTPDTLTSAARAWPTPEAADGSRGSLTHMRGNPTLKGAAMWPTATAGDAKASGAAAYSTASGRHSGTTLTDAAYGLWASPQARDWKSGHAQKTTEELYGKRAAPLSHQAVNWQTPNAKDSDNAGSPNRPALTAQARAQAVNSAGLLALESPSTLGKRQDWPTPTAHEGRRPGVDIHSTQEGNLSRDVAREWATPQAHDSTPGDASRVGRYGTKHGGRNLNDEAVATEWPTPRANRHGASDSHGKSPIRGSLNPAWVTQLMQFPDGWLDSEPPTPPRTGGKR